MTRYGAFGAYGSTGESEEADRRWKAEKVARPILDKALAAIEARKETALANLVGVDARNAPRIRAQIRATADAQVRLAYELFEIDVECGDNEDTGERWDALINPERVEVAPFMEAAE